MEISAIIECTPQDKTTLLVVDRACDKYHKDRGLPIRDDLPYVRKISSQDADEGHEEDEEFIDTRLQTVTEGFRANTPSEQEFHQLEGNMDGCDFQTYYDKVTQFFLKIK